MGILSRIFRVKESELYNKAMADGYVRDKLEEDRKRELKIKKDLAFARMTESLDRR